MGFWWWLFGCVLGMIFMGTMSYFSVRVPIENALNECERTHDVYQCKLVPTPVTPDGQPLDMSDPFHGEDE